MQIAEKFPKFDKNTLKKGVYTRHSTDSQTTDPQTGSVVLLDAGRNLDTTRTVVLYQYKDRGCNNSAYRIDEILFAERKPDTIEFLLPNSYVPQDCSQIRTIFVDEQLNNQALYVRDFTSIPTNYTNVELRTAQDIVHIGGPSCGALSRWDIAAFAGQKTECSAEYYNGYRQVPEQGQQVYSQEMPGESRAHQIISINETSLNMSIDLKLAKNVTSRLCSLQWTFERVGSNNKIISYSRSQRYQGSSFDKTLAQAKYQYCTAYKIAPELEIANWPPFDLRELYGKTVYDLRGQGDNQGTRYVLQPSNVSQAVMPSALGAKQRNSKLWTLEILPAVRLGRTQFALVVLAGFIAVAAFILKLRRRN